MMPLMTDRVPNQDLIGAALSAMKATGKPLRRIETGTRSMQYMLENGETVRLRSCNDHVLVVIADSTSSDSALNIEGTDHLLVVMPAKPRTPGPVNVYFLPASIGASDVREAHRLWLASKPDTKGSNRTWNVWFAEGPPGCSHFAEKWAQYQVTSTSTQAARADISKPLLGDVIAKARIDIAAAAGVSLESVKISVVLD
jgi:hypothetical protein